MRNWFELEWKSYGFWIWTIKALALIPRLTRTILMRHEGRKETQNSVFHSMLAQLKD